MDVTYFGDHASAASGRNPDRRIRPLELSRPVSRYAARPRSHPYCRWSRLLLGAIVRVDGRGLTCPVKPQASVTPCPLNLQEFRRTVMAYQDSIYTTAAAQRLPRVRTAPKPARSRRRAGARASTISWRCPRTPSSSA